MQEARELANDPCTDYSGAPLEARRYLLSPAMDLTATRPLERYLCEDPNLSCP